MDLKKRLDQYKRDGFTVFEKVFDQASIQAWKDAYKGISRRQTPPGSKATTAWLSSTLEYEPILFLPVVAHPDILDFAELVMGPFVQMDNLTFMAFPSVPREEATGKVSGWHRDIWSFTPTHSEYCPPFAVNAIMYLQDMTDEYGPLRVIPGSHRSTLSIAESDRQKPHSDEVLVKAKSGDVVFTHAALIHSGTPNYSGHSRYFLSIYYNKSWLKVRDNHHGPAVQMILKTARENGDRRLMRLFGEDPLLFNRANSGFLMDDEFMWKKWIEEDRAKMNL